MVPRQAENGANSEEDRCEVCRVNGHWIYRGHTVDDHSPHLVQHGKDGAPHAYREGQLERPTDEILALVEDDGNEKEKVSAGCSDVNYVSASFRYTEILFCRAIATRAIAGDGAAHTIEDARRA